MFNEMIAEKTAELRPYMVGGHWKMEVEDKGDEEVMEVKRAEKR